MGYGATAYPGYTFGASGATAYLVNLSGQTVHTWTASSSAQTCAYLLPDGSALFPIQNTSCTSPSHNGAWPSGRFQKISWDGAILWDFTLCDSTARCGYDVEPMPNGNILIPADSSSVAKIFEVQPTGATSGSVIWTCTLPSALTGSTTYINSVSYNPDLDLILVDLQDPQRKLVVVSHSTGNVVLTYLVGASGRVHAANWVTRYFMGTTNLLPDADFVAMRTNNLLVVYNGGDKAVEVGLAATNLVRSFSYAFNDHEGSIQRLPNGNTLVNPGGSATVTELDDSGATVGTISMPASVQRAYRYGYAYSGVSRLGTNRLTIVSAHGSPSPSGTSTNAYGTLITATVTSPETTAGNLQYTTTGWTLSGGTTTNGATSGGTASVTLATTNSLTTLTWGWATNYWLALTTNGGGAITVNGAAPGWIPSTNSAIITAAPKANWHFATWSGATNGCTMVGAQLTAPMTQARGLTGNFTMDTNVFLSISLPDTAASTFTLTATNLPEGATAVLQSTATPTSSNWQTSLSFTVTATATNWLLPRTTNAAAFYRLVVQ
ncbi:MAG: hypothetical protein QM813_10285 [Verrucomicrobiota bacterium]